jgi:hypothetical protein
MFVCFSMSSKKNVTLKIDSGLLREIKILAAREDTSISSLMTQLLEDRVKKDLDYEQAKRRALARIHNARRLNWQKPRSRDELYER